MLRVLLALVLFAPNAFADDDEPVCSYTVTAIACRMCCETSGIKACRNLPQNKCPKKDIKEFNGESSANERPSYIHHEAKGNSENVQGAE